MNNMEDLMLKIIKIIGIDIVDKGNEPNTWKELEVKVEDYEKGVHYSIPIKKKDGSLTKAYQQYKEEALDTKILEQGSVEIGIGYSEKEYPWNKDGNSGVNRYRTIRFFKKPNETQFDISRNPEKDQKTEEGEEEAIDLDNIKW